MLPGNKKGKCFICGSEGYTENHHVFGGSTRHNADRDGLTVDLCMDHHRGFNGVHTARGKEYMDYLHEEGQKYYEAMKMEQGRTAEEARADFIRDYIKSYL